MTTILLVEDDKYQRLLYEQELRFEGYEIGFISQLVDNTMHGYHSKLFDVLGLSLLMIRTYKSFCLLHYQVVLGLAYKIE